MESLPCFDRLFKIALAKLAEGLAQNDSSGALPVEEDEVEVRPPRALVPGFPIGLEAQVPEAYTNYMQYWGGKGPEALLDEVETDFRRQQFHVGDCLWSYGRVNGQEASFEEFSLRVKEEAASSGIDPLKVYAVFQQSLSVEFVHWAHTGGPWLHFLQKRGADLSQGTGIQEIERLYYFKNVDGGKRVFAGQTYNFGFFFGPLLALQFRCTTVINFADGSMNLGLEVQPPSTNLGPGDYQTTTFFLTDLLRQFQIFFQARLREL